MRHRRPLLLVIAAAIAALLVVGAASARPASRPPAGGQGAGNGNAGNGGSSAPSNGNPGNGGTGGGTSAPADDSAPVAAPAPPPPPPAPGGGASNRDDPPSGGAKGPSEDKGTGGGNAGGKGPSEDKGTGGGNVGGKGPSEDKGNGNAGKGPSEDKGNGNAGGKEPQKGKPADTPGRGTTTDGSKGSKGDAQKGKPTGIANGSKGRGPLDSSCNAVGGTPAIPGDFAADPAWVFDDFGAKTLDADTTAAKLVSANRDGDSTTCNRTRDGSAYWTPALLADGERIPASQIDARYRPARGITGRRSSVPVGFTTRIDSTNAEGPITFRCGEDGTPGAEPLVCAKDDLIATVRLPSCWDGVTPDPATQLWNVAPVEGGKCPEGYPVAIPRMTFQIHYDTSAVVPVDPATEVVWTLSTGATSTFSLGFINGWDQDAIRRLGDRPTKPAKPVKPSKSRKPARA